MIGRALWLAVALWCLGAPRSSGDDAEPPSDVTEGEDYVEAAEDTLAGGEVELGLGFVGTERSIERRRRVTFSGEDLSGTVREGSGDPLAGGTLVERGRWGELVAGKLSPRWDRGLLLGSPGNPWESAAFDPRRRRGRSGEGAEVRVRAGVSAIVGRFASRPLGGVRVARGPLSVACLAARGAEPQAAVGISGTREAMEAAIDRQGRWRAEWIWLRGGDRARLLAAVRCGSPPFRSLAEPRRSGPARSATVRLERQALGARWSALASCWRFQAGRSGARAAIELDRPLGPGRSLVAGFEEQQGERGELRSARGVRQGGWIEWSRAAAPLGLALRHETWGARPGLRDVTRLVSSCRIEAALPREARVSVAHTVFRVRRGESLYLREAESDRIVLRALSGEGQRTQLDLRLPFARGILRASAQLSTIDGGRSSRRWRLEWTRRARAGAARGRGHAPAEP